MTAATTPAAGLIPPALHVASDDFPEAEAFGGVEGVNMKVLMADAERAVFVVRIRFAAGVQLATHAHTGAVYAFTLSGEWCYLEYADEARNRKGSFLYEPPGSLHTLKVTDGLDEDTDVVFVIEGAMIIQDESGQVVAVLDAASHLRDYPDELRRQGKPVPAVVVGGQAGYLS